VWFIGSSDRSFAGILGDVVIPTFMGMTLAKKS